MDNLAPTIYQSQVPSKTLPPYDATQCYWIESAGEGLLIDTGDGSEAGLRMLEADWRALGSPRIKAVFATHHHLDHTGGGKWAQQFFQCPIYLHILDQRALGPSDVKWSHYDSPWIIVGNVRVEVIFAPGHTPGQWNFWIPSERVLLSGDNVLGDSTVVIAPPDGHLGTYLTTLGKLQQLAAKLIGPGHGTTVPNPESYLAHYIEHRTRRGDEILRHLLHHPNMSLSELAQAIYGDSLAPEKMAIGQWMIQGHLQLFLEQGLIRQNESHFSLAEEVPDEHL